MSLNALEAGASPAVSHDEEKALVSKVAWRLMPLIMVCYLFAFFDRINISFAKFQLQTDL
ncbi:MAG: MFS transporter, partial [Pseudomonas sp.]